MMFPDGRVMVINQLGQWVEVRPLPAVQQQQPELFQARATSRPPVSQASSISEEIAEEVLAQPATKARASVPVVEEEDDLSSPPMTFLSSQDRPQSESGTCSSWTESEPVDLSRDFAPLTKQEAAPTPTTSTTVEVQKYAVARRVQVRAGPTATSENLFVLSPPQRVHVVKTQTTQTKTGFVVTKAYVLANQGQGWVSVNRQNKKTREAFVFKGRASDGFKRLIKFEKVWERHQATVVNIRNTTEGTFTVCVKCPRWQQVESLRSELKNNRLCGKTLVNRRTPELVNLKRVFGNNRPCAHVFNIDVDYEHGHQEFLEDFDWSNQYKGSTKDFQHQVRSDLRELKFGGVRRVTWEAGHTSSGRFSMRDYCSVEFAKDSQLRNFLRNFQRYEFFQGAQVKVDPIYGNLTSVSVESLEC